MKFASALVVACISSIALPAAAQGFSSRPAPNTWGAAAPADQRTRAPAITPQTFGAPPTYGRANPPRPAFAAEPSMPQSSRFRPYGDRSGIARGGPGAYPSAPKPRGYIDIYGNKPSEHPFRF